MDRDIQADVLSPSSQFLRTGMTELGDNPELQTHSQAVLYIIAAVSPPRTSIVDDVLSIFIDACKTSESWRTRLHTLSALSSKSPCDEA